MSSADAIFSSLVYNDLEYLGEQVIVRATDEPTEAINLWRAFDKYYTLAPHKVEFGRLYNTRLMGQVVMVSTLADMIGTKPGLDSGLRINEVEPDLPHAPFDDWSGDNWLKLLDLTRTIQKSILRNDADVEVCNVEDANKNDDTLHETRLQNHELYVDKFQKVLQSIQLQKALIPFRAALSKRKADEADDTEEIDEKDAMEIWESYNELEEGHARETLKIFFMAESEQPENRKGRNPAKKQRLQLKPPGDLRDALGGTRNFSTHTVHLRLVKLMRSWLTDAFKRRPKLNDVYLRKASVTPKEEEDQENRNPAATDIPSATGSGEGFVGMQEDKNESNVVDEEQDDGKPATDGLGEIEGNSASGVVQRLNRAREFLLGVNDPLQETIVLADLASGRHGNKKRPSAGASQKSNKKSKQQARPNFYDKKLTSRALVFEDSDSEDQNDSIEDSDEDRDGGPRLSSLPKRRNNSKSSSKQQKGGSQKKRYEGRRRWSDEEKRAIKEGVRELGEGHWAMIKKQYDIILGERTSVQIKDCFRTMKKRGELGTDI